MANGSLKILTWTCASVPVLTMTTKTRAENAPQPPELPHPPPELPPPGRGGQAACKQLPSSGRCFSGEGGREQRQRQRLTSSAPRRGASAPSFPLGRPQPLRADRGEDQAVTQGPSRQLLTL